MMLLCCFVISTLISFLLKKKFVNLLKGTKRPATTFWGDKDSSESVPDT